MGAKPPQVAGFGALSFAFDPGARRGRATKDESERSTTATPPSRRCRPRGSVRGVVRDRAAAAAGSHRALCRHAQNAL